ncbi:MAG: succinyl-diaminopimelate desuccinylase [Planctomycetes bacterium]|nr:succinyl-diaminopimelate desuccinylase [Planctomycetota bacterium]
MPVIERVFGLAEDLLRTASPYGAERTLAELLASRFDRNEVREVLRAGDSLCVVPRPLRAGVPRIVLAGHLDTVPELTPNPVRRDGERLFGTGASDMKGALAVIVDALERAVREAPRHDLVGVLYAREEGPFEASGLPEILAVAGERVLDASLAILMEPTDGRIELGCMGAAQARVVFEGKRAHAARPWQGVNALHAAGPLLARLKSRAPREVVIGGLPWREVVSATTVAFRGALNVVPDRCELGLNLRFAPGRTRDDVVRELEELVAGEAEVAIESLWPAGCVVTGHPLVAELRAACGGAAVSSKQAWTDVGRLSELGVPAVNWGPGAVSQAHQAGEWIELRAIAEASRALGSWLWPE